MEKLIPIFDQIVQFILKVLGNLGVFGGDNQLPGIINQYYEDGKTVGGAIKDAAEK